MKINRRFGGRGVYFDDPDGHFFESSTALLGWSTVTQTTRSGTSSASLRFIDAGHNVMIMGPVGVGKIFMANALGHAGGAVCYTVSFCRSRRVAQACAPAGRQLP